MNPMFAQQQMLEQQLLHAAEVMEEQIDSEMKKMDELDEDDIEKIRQRRLKAMQKAHQAKQVSSPWVVRLSASLNLNLRGLSASENFFDVRLVINL